MREQKFKVLLVEDEPICRYTEKHILEEYGCLVQTAKTAQEAFELVNSLNVDLLEKQYDFIFMDIGLPDINGDYVTEMIRKTEEWTKPVPIIAVTSYSAPKDKKRFSEKGITDIIIKPLSMTKLKNVLKKY
ncbi:MAG: response regulator [Gammaproteobacteria bacterium]|nr:response regulator [Gammaproteobacteria bacterium]